MTWVKAEEVEGEWEVVVVVVDEASGSSSSSRASVLNRATTGTRDRRAGRHRQGRAVPGGLVRNRAKAKRPCA